MTPLLDLVSVSFAFEQGRDVLAGVDLRVERGEVVVVVGPNGAGKTTLLRLASGYLRPREGRVLLEGRDLWRLDRREAARRIAGVVAEGEPAFPFTVQEAVELGRHPWRGAFGGLGAADREAVDAALAETGLGALRDRPVTALSSGERQRVLLARCIAQGGDLLLLDEPTAHLDVAHRARALDRFRRRAHAGGPGVLAVLHDLTLAGLVADRVVLLVDGRVRAAGAPAEVLAAPSLADAFGAALDVLVHPLRGTPVVVPRIGGEEDGA